MKNAKKNRSWTSNNSWKGCEQISSSQDRLRLTKSEGFSACFDVSMIYKQVFCFLEKLMSIIVLRRFASRRIHRVRFLNKGKIIGRKKPLNYFWFQNLQEHIICANPWRNGTEIFNLAINNFPSFWFPEKMIWFK